MAFRAVFEDRPKQLIIQLSKSPEPVYYVFSPDTCAIRKVWRGGIDFRGKVYDFSQENSYATGTTLYENNGVILDDTAFGLNGGKSVQSKLLKPGESISSHQVSIQNWGPIYFSFDEKGDKDYVWVSFKQNQTPFYEYRSSGTIMGPNFWQWNYKQIPAQNRSDVEVTLSVAPTGAEKTLRNFLLFGDRWAWYGQDTKPLPVKFGGYQVSNSRASVRCSVGTSVVTTTLSMLSGELRWTLVLSGEDSLNLAFGKENGPQISAAPNGLTTVTGENIVHFPGPGTYNLRMKI
jgi:hypothetical protein